MMKSELVAVSNAIGIGIGKIVGPNKSVGGSDDGTFLNGKVSS